MNGLSRLKNQSIRIHVYLRMLDRQSLTAGGGRDNLSISFVDCQE